MPEEKQHNSKVQNRYVVPPIYLPKTQKTKGFLCSKFRYHYIPQEITFLSIKENEKKDTFYMRNEANSL